MVSILVNGCLRQLRHYVQNRCVQRLTIFRKNLLSLALFLFLFSSPAIAHSYTAGDIAIGHIWTRATSLGMTTCAVYLPLLNKGAAADKFLGASSPIADKIELHESMKMDHIASMQKLDHVDLLPNTPVALSPGGIHLMVIGLKKQLKVGEMMPLTLEFEKAGTINVEAEVEGAGATHSGP